MITVEAIDNMTFKVTVEGLTTTTHTVIVSPTYYEKLTSKRISAEELVRRSSEFLLDRESNTSILRRFDLPEISRYFPEYESTIRSRLD